MKPTIIVLVLFLTFQDITASSCVETFEKRERDYYDFYNDYDESKEDLTESSTLTCFNLSSIENLPLPSMYKHVPQEYKQYLNITESRISTIPKNAFSTFHNITKLYLSGVGIINIEMGAFNNLTNLKELYLDDNILEKLSDEMFSDLEELEILDLNDNIITYINSRAFAGLKNLKKLNLKDNFIKFPTKDLFTDLKNIEVLDLSVNPISRFSQNNLALSENLTLLELDLSHTLLDTFELDLSNTSLKYLNLSSNKLTAFDLSLLPQDIYQVTLSKNNIENITNQEKLNSQRILLDNNQIKNLNLPFVNVSELYLSHNMIKLLEGSPFYNSKRLETIDLSHNSISSIGKDVFLGLSNLRTLNLSYNLINEITSGTFKNLSYLGHLDLSHNNIKKLQFGIFETLTRLVLLDVSNNQMVKLDQHALYPLSSLSDLRFDNNQITSIDVEALTIHCKDLTKVSLNNNSWTCKNLVNIYHKFKLHNVDVAMGHSLDAENFHGIPCVNKKEVDEPEVKNFSFSIENFYKDFQKAVNKGVLDSKINRFFNEDFQNSSFYRYFYANYNSSKPLEGQDEDPGNKNSGMLIAVNIIQMILSLFVLVVIFLIFIALRKHRQNVRSQFASQTELFYKHR